MISEDVCECVFFYLYICFGYVRVWMCGSRTKRVCVTFLSRLNIYKRIRTPHEGNRRGGSGMGE